MREFLDILSPKPLQEAILYRGDATKIDDFDISKTGSRALLGPGIYLTDDVDIAADYTLKQNENVLYTDPEAKTQRQIIAGYIRKIMDEEIGWDESRNDRQEQWQKKNYPDYRTSNGGMSSRYWDMMRSDLAKEHQALTKATFPSVRDKVRAMLPSLKIVRNTMGELSLVSKERSGAISSFDIPDSYLKRVLHAERPLPDAVIKVIRGLWIAEMGPKGHDMRDANEKHVTFDQYIKGFKTTGSRYAWSDRMIGAKGVNPSLDELWKGTNGGASVFIDSLFDKTGRHSRFVAAMTKLGYVGLEYEGGVRMGDNVRGGGGKRHRAFVFWNTQEIAAFRKGDQPMPIDLDLDPNAVEKHAFSRLYRAPEH